MNRLLKLITTNTGIKVFCLSVSIVLWIYVFMTQNSVAKFPSKLSIRAMNVPENLSPNFQNSGIEIQVSAEASIWRRLSASSFTAYIDLSGYTAGTYEVPVIVNSSVAGVTVVAKNPDRILVTLEPVITKEFTISQKFEGALASGYVVSNVSFEPKKASIKGPKEAIENISEISAIIKLSDQKANFTQTFSVLAFDSSNNPIETVTIDPQEVDAVVTVVKGSNVKAVGVKPKFTGSVKQNYTISSVSLAPDTLDITGSGSKFDATSFLDTQDINIDGIDKKTEYTIGPDLPDGIKLLNSDEKVHVTVDVQPISLSKKVDISSFKIKNSSLNLDSTTPKEISLTFSYTANVNAAVFSDVFIWLDINKAYKTADNTYRIQLARSDIFVPSGLELQDFATVEVVLQTK